MARYETARRTIGCLPARRPATGVIVIGRGIESQSGNDRKSVAFPRVDSDPLATAASTVFAELG